MSQAPPGASDDGDLLDVDDLDRADPDGADPGPAADGERPGPPAPGRSRRRTRWGVVAALVVVVVAAAAVRGAVADDDAPEPTPSTPLTSADLFPGLAQEPTAGWGFPGGPATRALGVVRRSAQLLATTPSAAFWTALDEDGDICLLSRATPGSDPLRGTCSPVSEVAASGVRLAGADGQGALLLPERASGADVATFGFEQLTRELWVDGGTAGSVAQAAAARVLAGAAGGAAAVVVPADWYRGTAALPPVEVAGGRSFDVVLACLQPVVVQVQVDSDPPVVTECAREAPAHRFVASGDGEGAGDGGVRVLVLAPERQVWAAGVVACAGPAFEPSC